MVTVGDKAPEFESKAYFPAEKKVSNIKLSDYKGKWVLLTFHPGDFTFVCATDLEAFQAFYDKFKENNAEVLAISTDSIYSHKMWVETSPRVGKVKFPLVDDLKKEISATYGFLNQVSGMTRRGTVIIDPDGIVRFIEIQDDRLGKDLTHIYNAFINLKYLYEHPPKPDEFEIIAANKGEGFHNITIRIPDSIGKL